MRTEPDDEETEVFSGNTARGLQIIAPGDAGLPLRPAGSPPAALASENIYTLMNNVLSFCINMEAAGMGRGRR